MTTITLYLLLLIAQGSGGASLVSHSKVECEEARVEVLKDPSVLYVSECMEVTLKKLQVS